MILCCGEALIDMIPVTDADGGRSFRPHAGGAVFNTAIALGRLGIDTGFVSGISTDLFGEMLSSALTDSKVATDKVVFSNLPTTLAFVRLRDGHATYSFYDENTAGRMLTPDQLPQISDDTQALYFGGISLISEPCAEFYTALAVREAASRVIIADPNIRTSFISDEARYRARLDRLVAHCDVLKVSDEDLEWIVPQGDDLIEKANVLRAQGPKIVIVTTGSKGASAVFGDGQVVSVAAKRVTVADTVGAGDTFNAGVLARLAQAGLLSKQALGAITADQLSAALTNGALVAAVTVSRHGANPPWAHELVQIDLG